MTLYFAHFHNFNFNPKTIISNICWKCSTAYLIDEIRLWLVLDKTVRNKLETIDEFGKRLSFA